MHQNIKNYSLHNIKLNHVKQIFRFHCINNFKQNWSNTPNNNWNFRFSRFFLFFPFLSFVLFFFLYFILCFFLDLCFAGQNIRFIDYTKTDLQYIRYIDLCFWYSVEMSWSRWFWQHIKRLNITHKYICNSSKSFFFLHVSEEMIVLTLFYYFDRKDLTNKFFHFLYFFTILSPKCLVHK